MRVRHADGPVAEEDECASTSGSGKRLPMHAPSRSRLMKRVSERFASFAERAVDYDDFYTHHQVDSIMRRRQQHDDELEELSEDDEDFEAARDYLVDRLTGREAAAVVIQRAFRSHRQRRFLRRMPSFGFLGAKTHIPDRLWNKKPEVRPLRSYSIKAFEAEDVGSRSRGPSRRPSMGVSRQPSRQPSRHPSRKPSRKASRRLSRGASRVMEPVQQTGPPEKQLLRVKTANQSRRAFGRSFKVPAAVDTWSWQDLLARTKTQRRKRLSMAEADPSDMPPPPDGLPCSLPPCGEAEADAAAAEAVAPAVVDVAELLAQAAVAAEVEEAEVERAAEESAAEEAREAQACAAAAAAEEEACAAEAAMGCEGDSAPGADAEEGEGMERTALPTGGGAGGGAWEDGRPGRGGSEQREASASASSSPQESLPSSRTSPALGLPPPGAPQTHPTLQPGGFFGILPSVCMVRPRPPASGRRRRGSSNGGGGGGGGATLQPLSPGAAYTAKEAPQLPAPLSTTVHVRYGLQPLAILGGARVSSNGAGGSSAQPGRVSGCGPPALPGSPSAGSPTAGPPPPWQPRGGSPARGGLAGGGSAVLLQLGGPMLVTAAATPRASPLSGPQLPSQQQQFLQHPQQQQPQQPPQHPHQQLLSVLVPEPPADLEEEPRQAPGTGRSPKPVSLPSSSSDPGRSLVNVGVGPRFPQDPGGLPSIPSGGKAAAAGNGGNSTGAAAAAATAAVLSGLVGRSISMPGMDLIAPNGLGLGLGARGLQSNLRVASVTGANGQQQLAPLPYPQLLLHAAAATAGGAVAAAARVSPPQPFGLGAPGLACGSSATAALPVGLWASTKQLQAAQQQGPPVGSAVRRRASMSLCLPVGASSAAVAAAAAGAPAAPSSGPSLLPGGLSSGFVAGASRLFAGRTSMPVPPAGPAPQQQQQQGSTARVLNDPVAAALNAAASTPLQLPLLKPRGPSVV